ncbi:MAG: hypothetical protein FRX48_02817 [Lasallia pustulata]|uniref:Uncharacterized protein n=1 Tax=Lasallia pustulata TaxID=136370 RepID=A0A5M8PWI3_9LECA|nr:MAG: hypothetical protein FRX48_02817 [Lasallia pustulata]
MNHSAGDQSPKFTFCDDDGRAKIEEYVPTTKFRPGDQAYFCVRGTEIREGPYTVSSVPTVRKYTLSLANGQPVKDGNVVEEEDLERVENTQSMG